MLLPRDLERRAHSRLGTILNGKYRLDAVLGVGGMASVYAAEHRNAKRVAVKVLHPELSANSTVRTHFQREGYAANTVAHRGAVQVYDDDETDDGTVFIVMELLDGASVEELRRRHGGQLAVPWAISIVDQLLDVLSAAHTRKVVHRDIKPPNLFLIADGSLKVLDFGIARIRDAARFGGGPWTATGDLLGTAGFMAPEQALGRSEEVDEQTDLWAASATLFNLISGALAHCGTNQQELRVSAARDPARLLESVAPGTSPVIAHIVNRGLAHDKAARWQTAASMREALHAAHVETFGRPPELVDSTKWESPSPAVPVGVSSTLLVDDDPGEQPMLVLSSTTERPVFSAAAPGGIAKKWRPAALIAAAIMILSGAGLLRRTPRSEAQASIVSLPSPKDSAELAVIAPPPGSVELQRSLGAVDTGHRSLSVSSTPVPTSKPPSISASSHPRATSSPPPADCSPPTFVDGAGVKYPKPQCI